VTWFIVLVVVHAILWSVKGYVPRALSEAIFFTSFLPWLPFAWAGIPWLSAPGIFIMPNAFGLAWCVAVWLVIYWFIAGGLHRLTLLASTDRSSKHAA
jgi:hypothetical protein